MNYTNKSSIYYKQEEIKASSVLPSSTKSKKRLTLLDEPLIKKRIIIY